MVQLGEKDQGCKMIIGLKKNTQKQASLCYKKLSMSKKNSSASLKVKFKDHEELSKIYLKFKGKIRKYLERAYSNRYIWWT